MIRNQWYIVLESREVKSNKLTGVMRLGENLVFWRDSNRKAYCFQDRCPHLGASLSQGKIKGGRLVCPFHGFEYDTNGLCIYLPAVGQNGAIPNALHTSSYAVYESRGLIWIYWGESEKTPTPPEFFPSITDEFEFLSFRQTWPVHYSRMIENQLDVMHLPFIHHNTIGRGNKTVVDGPLVKVQDGLLNIWVFNRLDDGTPPRKMQELVTPSRNPFLQFIFPNLWQNWISDTTRITIAFVPVAEEKTLLYGRVYQKKLPIPGLTKIINLGMVLGSHIIANQDKRVVSNILPKRSRLKNSGEILVQGDQSVLIYRQYREKLLQENNHLSNKD